MFRYFKIVLTIILAAGLGSCADSVEMPENMLLPGSPGTLTIRFQSTDLTRSDDSDKSEFKISTLSVGLYADNGNNDEPAMRFINLGTVDKPDRHQFTMALDDETVIALFGDINNNNAKCRIFAVANLPVNQTYPAEKPTINQLKNLDISSQFNTSKVQLSFVMCGEGTVTYTAPAMAGTKGKAEGSVAMVRAAAKINVNLAVPDIIHVQVGPDADDYEIWAPEKGAIFALINNGVKNAVVAPEQSADGDPWRPADPAEDYYYSTLGTVSERQISYNDKVPAENDYKYTMDVPFYTYPNAWTESDLETTKTTLTLTVPWRKMKENESGQLVGEGSWQTYYYQIPVTPVTMPLLLRNHSYTINMTVGMLGSPTPETEEVVEDLSYQIVPWGQEDLNVEIQDFRYLLVDPNIITVENEDEIIIPFYSSHPVSISDVTMTFQRFNYYSDGNGDVVEIQVDEEILNLSTWTYRENGTQVTEKMCSFETYSDPTTNQLYLKVKHPLNIWTPINSTTATNVTNGNRVNLTGITKPTGQVGDITLNASDMGIKKFIHGTETPYSPYVFKLKLRHSDNASYNQEIKITQYPGMYIKADRNTGGSYNTGSHSQQMGTRPNRYNKYTPITSDYGFVFVNPISTYVPDNENGNPNPVPFSYWTNDSDLGNVHGLTGLNKNPNMYVITISQLDNTDAYKQYIIGDPRSNYINNDLTGNAGSLIPTQNQTTAAGDWCHAADALYSNPPSTAKRRLRYYYPTNEVNYGDINAKRIAPKIRIASSWGVSNSIGIDKARRRAATYQERSYPAGRWRLPTLGEFTFITQLSAAGKIPTLFSLNNNYLTAQGVYQVDGNGKVTRQNGATSTSIRAVYDEWYWEQYPQYSLDPSATSFSYTLGDVPRGVQ